MYEVVLVVSSKVSFPIKLFDSWITFTNRINLKFNSIKIKKAVHEIQQGPVTWQQLRHNLRHHNCDIVHAGTSHI